MKEMDAFVKAFGEGLRTLAQGVQVIADKLDSYLDSSGDNRDFEPEPAAENDFNATRAEEKPEKKVSPKKPAVNATAKVYEIIINAQKSITYDELITATGYDRKKLSNVLHRLKKQNKIKNVEKGVYTGK